MDRNIWGSGPDLAGFSEIFRICPGMVQNGPPRPWGHYLGVWGPGIRLEIIIRLALISNVCKIIPALFPLLVVHAAEHFVAKGQGRAGPGQSNTEPGPDQGQGRWWLSLGAKCNLDKLPVQSFTL